MITSERINLMHVVLNLGVGGLEKLVSDIVLHLNRKIFNVEVCCLDSLGYFSNILNNKEINVTLIQRNQKHYDTFYPFRLMKLLRKKNIHILHMHSGTLFLATQAGILARTPLMVYTDHGRHLFDSPKIILMDRVSSFFVDKIIAVSKELENYLTSVVKISRNKIVTVVNGINTSLFYPREKPQNLLEEFKIAGDYKVIGTVGRLAEVKDHASLIKAFKIVHARIPKSVLMIVGDGPLKEQLLEAVAENNLNNSVIFTGNRNDLPELLSLFDVFVLSSLSEGTSVSLLEAMAAGIPPVVTDVGGNRSIVDDMVNGIFVKPKDINHMAEAIITLLCDERTHKKFSANALHKVHTQYRIDKMIDYYTSIYLNLFQGTSPKHLCPS